MINALGTFSLFLVVAGQVVHAARERNRGNLGDRDGIRDGDRDGVSRIRGITDFQCANFLRNGDCRRVANEEYCYIYSNECQSTCGCDYDPTDDRIENGLDDAYYASIFFQCVTDDAFEDSQGFNCTLYEGAQWCMVNDAGVTVEGPGWCDWMGDSICGLPMSDRWPKFENYANDDGQWAKNCCCNTGLADTYPYESPDGECVDILARRGLPWHDSNGYSCRAYHFGSFCTLDGEPGIGWDMEKYGSIEQYEYQRMTPLEACCTCGGGTIM